MGEQPVLDHVQIAAPSGCEMTARWFYGTVIGLIELQKPEPLRSRGGVWFSLGDAQLHVGIEEPFTAADKAHPAMRFSTGGLQAVARRLTEAGTPVHWDTALPGVSRFFTDDPWGNRLELLARCDQSTGAEIPARLVGIGSGLARLEGYPFEMRYSDGALARATVAADVAAAAYSYFDRLFSGVEPEIALIVADQTDWLSRQPYGLAFFNDDPGQIRPGVVVMPASRGDFWTATVQDLRDAAPREYPKLLETYPDGAGGVDLQPFCDLITVHELGHAFETLGDLRLPTSWLSEIFVNLAMHAFVATQMPASLPTLEVLATVGAESRTLAGRMRAEGYSTLEELEAHYTGGDHPMSPLNYVWFQYRWQRLAAAMFQVDGEAGLVRFWDRFHAADRVPDGQATAASLAPLLTSEISRTLGHAVRDWR